MNRNCNRDRTNGRNDGGENESTDSTEFWLANSRVIIETGPVGNIARIERFGDTYVCEYGGPLPEATVDALSEVSH
jgi:hypothetical protein